MIFPPMDPRVIAKYQSREGAESYNELYVRRWHKRLSHRTEVRVIRKAFSHVEGPVDWMLDLPSGTGRLFPTIREYARRYVETDVSFEMLRLARRNLEQWRPHLVQASAFHIPYRDGAFDCVFSARLFHHIPDRGERHRYIRELCRVSRKWVVLTYFHTWSLKNILRRLRRPFNRKRPKITMTTGELRDVAEGAGWEVVASIPLSRLFSGHHYAVLRRRPGPA